MARELCSSIPLRIPHPKIDKLACQSQGVGIFAVRRNIPIYNAYLHIFILTRTTESQSIFYHISFLLSSLLQKLTQKYGFYKATSKKRSTDNLSVEHFYLSLH